MNPVLLDTTALLTHYFGEPGAEDVQEVLEEGSRRILICAVSVTEFARRLATLGESAPTARQRALEYAGLCDAVIEVDTALAIRAFEIAAGAPARIPLVDTLIAAAAQLHGATLVHRDAHFGAIAAVQQRAVGRQ